MKIYTLFTWVTLCSLAMSNAKADASDGSLEINIDTSELTLQVHGDEDDAWIFESSNDLETWSSVSELGSVFSNSDPLSIDLNSASLFYRARLILNFYDPSLVRTIELTFEEEDWVSILQDNYADESLLAGGMSVDGFDFPSVGIRYKGNTSYTRSGDKKSIAIEMDFVDPEADLYGYDSFNFNNAFNDETLMREALYFNSIKEYAITPNAGFVKIFINGENWGVYSNAQQQNSELLEEWFDDYDGDRWKSPSGTGAGGGTTGGDTGGGRGGGGGGGGGFATGDKALLYLGDDSALYEAQYELKTQKTDDPWSHLINASKVLSETDPASSDYRETVDTVLAVDRWLWFLAAENIFTDDDSYWNKGADYQIYYEPESGQIHPIEHDGNEAFTVNDSSLEPMYQEDNANRPVISKFLSSPELRERYLAHYRTILAERFNPEYLNALIDEYKEVIEAEVALDPKITFTFEEFETDITDLKEHIQSRYDFLTTELEVSQIAPTIVSVSMPDTPLPGESVAITATVEENASDGISGVYLYYRQGGSGQYLDVQMLDDGLSSDGSANDGVYGGSIPSYLAGQKVRYYVEARSGNSANTAVFSPARAELEPYKYEIETTQADSTVIVINEFMASNDAAYADPQGDFDDWIELHNISDSEVDLSGMYLSDNAGNPRKWEIPEGTLIAAGGYLIVWADEDGSDELGLHANFKLSASGEEILIVDTDENLNLVLDYVEYSSADTDVSIGRTAADSELFDSMAPSPGEQNQ
ncbi:CotH kinase family protein [Puniceicoccaceae bacterium K14]|nr:CotH kinase family protein [Puniceicoccaceae bacterium K14]